VGGDSNWFKADHNGPQQRDERTCMLLISSCDEGYFPLLKGLVLSILESPSAQETLRLAFLDIGCAPASIEWLRARGVTVLNMEAVLPDGLGAPLYRYHRAQICRPFLPDIFPGEEVLAWVDCDTWFQDASVLATLRAEALACPDCVLASPEIHYTYTGVNEDQVARQHELLGYYEKIYESKIAEALSRRPAVNSGFFVMHRDHSLWAAWRLEIERIYRDEYDSHDPITRHFGEQMSLNKLILDGASVRWFDPSYNYLCLWMPPFRDEEGIVRMSAPPFSPIGMLHLAGGWKHFGRNYFEKGLLYKGGAYLSELEKTLLLADDASETFR
jgi:hypothetical protein